MATGRDSSPSIKKIHLKMVNSVESSGSSCHIGSIKDMKEALVDADSLFKIIKNDFCEQFC